MLPSPWATRLRSAAAPGARRTNGAAAPPPPLVMDTMGLLSAAGSVLPALLSLRLLLVAALSSPVCAAAVSSQASRPSARQVVCGMTGSRGRRRTNVDDRFALRGVSVSLAGNGWLCRSFLLALIRRDCRCSGAEVDAALRRVLILCVSFFRSEWGLYRYAAELASDWVERRRLQASGGR